jgi:hypothetical protein
LRSRAAPFSILLVQIAQGPADSPNPARTNCSVTRISLGDIEVYRRRRDSGTI